MNSPKNVLNKIIGGGIAKKFIIWTVVIIILLDILTAVFMEIDLKRTLSDELNERGYILSRHLAEESIGPLSEEDTVNLSQLARNIKDADTDVKYVYITNSRNSEVAYASDSGTQGVPPDSSTEYIIDFEAPIRGGSAGFVHIGMDRRFVDEKINRTTRLIISNILLEGGLGVLMAYIAGNYLTRPIRSLVKGAQEIGRGNLGYKIESGSTDYEILTLSNAFNQMSYNLNNSISELRISEERYRNLVELTTDIIYLSDREGRQTFMNNAAYRILEATPEEVIGQPWVKWIHPDERETTFKKFQEIMDKGIDIFNFETRYVSKSGKVVDVLHNVRVLWNDKGEVIGAQGIARDITEWKKAIETLRQLSTAVEEAPDGIQIVDLSGRVIYSNKAIEKIYGFAPDELKGKHVNEMNVDPEFASSVIIPNIKETGRWVGELMVKHKDGRTIPIWLNTSLVKDSRGNTIAMVGIIRDMTDQKEMEKLEMQLLQADKLATIGHLAAGIAHEINNPLGNISLYTQMLLKKTEDESSRSKLVTINDEANRAAQIVKGLLDFARQSELKLNPTDVNKEIGKVLSILHPQLKGIKVNTEFGDLPLILADSSQIQQVIMNLLTNSIQSITENGEITIKTTAKQQYVEISVSDNGCGIPDENMNKIFDPFFTTKGPGEGTGLGLSISYGIIKRHNGSIEVESEIGKGTTFTLKLPK